MSDTYIVQIGLALLLICLGLACLGECNNRYAEAAHKHFECEHYRYNSEAK